MDEQSSINALQEVSRVHSTDKRRNKKLTMPIGKEQIQKEKLHPQYVAGFIDGKSYLIFREIVLMVCDKKHLNDDGFEKIVRLRDELRALGKKAKTFGLGKVGPAV